jgi:hypothetical protein
MKILNFVFCSLVILCSGCDNNKDKIAKLEKEIESLKQENSRLQSFNNYTPPAAPPLPVTDLPDDVIDRGNNYINTYAQMSDARLVEEFKNYMSDEYFSFEEFLNSGKTIKIITLIVDNVKVRRLQRGNPEIFTEILNRFEKIIFTSSAYGNSITLNKLEE